MEILRNPRLYTFVLHVWLSSAVLAGVIDTWVGLIFAVLVLVTTYFYKMDQLPEERLMSNQKLADLFSGTAPSDWKERVVLHRGGAIDTPENTLEAIREAAKLGVAGVEIDLQFTADGVGVVLHDDTLDRTTDGVGDIRKMNYADIQNLDACAKHPKRLQYGYKVKIPTLEECLQESIQHKLLVFIDCKAFAQQTAQLVDRLVQKYPELYDLAVVCSFYPNIIYTMRKKNPKVLTALSYRKWAQSHETDCVTPRYTGIKFYRLCIIDIIFTYVTYALSWFFCGNSFLLLNKESLSRNEVRWWKSLGISVLPWTVNSQVEKQYCIYHLKLPIITDGLDVPE